MNLIQQMPNLPPELREMLDKGRKYDALAAELALIAAELVEVRRLWSEATASQCRISDNYDVLIVKNAQLESALRISTEQATGFLAQIRSMQDHYMGKVSGSALETKAEPDEARDFFDHPYNVLCACVTCQQARRNQAKETTCKHSWVKSPTSPDEYCIRCFISRPVETACECTCCGPSIVSAKCPIHGEQT